MLSKLTLQGLHSYTNGEIWNNLTLPEGLDKDILIPEILRQSAEFPLLYPDPNFMGDLIGSWSLKWYKNFEKWLNCYNKEYEPLFNVDVMTDWDEEAHAKSAADKNSSAKTDTRGSVSSVANDQHLVAAFDANNYVPKEQDSLSHSDSNSASTSSSESEHQSDSSENSLTHTEWKRGNQGVTMSQEMWLAEMNMWRWNIYQHIAEVFITEFCVPVYI